jgi:hypothetical protein
LSFTDEATGAEAGGGVSKDALLESGASIGAMLTGVVTAEGALVSVVFSSSVVPHAYKTKTEPTISNNFCDITFLYPEHTLPAAIKVRGNEK